MVKKYKLYNNVVGWVVFAIAAFTYLMTIEPTASLWDCGEFIATSFKLEVGHPPGAPLFMILARFFANFAGGDVTQVARMVNSMSALASAFTILFLFWTITHLARRIVLKSESDYTTGNIIAVLGAGLIGALAYNFSDTFWFSAVEGEVYATSSLFTAAVFWAILKWEDVADEPYANRWIILIACLMGLSIGVHLLNLLVIPAIVFVYYFRKFDFSWKGVIISLVASLTILVLLMYGIIPGIFRVTAGLELFFVNSLGLPFNSGMYFHFIVFAALMIFAVWYSYGHDDKIRNFIISAAVVLLSGIWLMTNSGFANFLFLVIIVGGVWIISNKDHVVLNTILTALLAIFIGYSSFATIILRASVDTPINENKPSNPFALLYYLNREQYGERPLFYGPYYNAPVTGYTEGKPVYNQSGGKYIITNHEIEKEYDKRFMTLFPRMWSDQDEHEEVYKQYVGNGGKPIMVTDPQTNESQRIVCPTFGQNLKFMFDYQIGYMYLRYLMWNFSGKQNDTQTYGGSANGNWITGIGFLDAPRVGSIRNLPAAIKDDRARNTFYLIPLILGLIGLLWQFYNDSENWWIVMLVFIMTGLAIVIYLNQYPNQPRERDYAYAGSFYAFTMWIGLGVLALYEAFKKLTGNTAGAIIAVVLSFITVPTVMASQDWNDHDRSGRYLTRDVAANYLNSCEKDAILFTNGDNDTFPLWYDQEVEGIRTDVRVCNLMLLNTDWYINQMKMKAYSSEPLPISLPVNLYYDGVNNQVLIFEKVKEPATAKEVIDFINSGSDAAKLKYYGSDLYYIPTRTIRIPVDKAAVLANGTVSPQDADKIVPYIDIKLKGSWLLKSQLMIIDILAHNDWKRPIYFVTGYNNDAMGLEEYFQCEGLAYRLVPIKSENKSWFEYGSIESKKMYDNMIHKFKWGGANNPSVDIDYFHRRTLTVIRARLQYSRLAKQLAAEGDKQKANEVLDVCMKALPAKTAGYDFYLPYVVEAYFAAGNKDAAKALTKDLSDYYLGEAEYYLNQSREVAIGADSEITQGIQIVSQALQACYDSGEVTMAEELNKRLSDAYAKYTALRQVKK
jgi:hypothetical protein